MIYDISITQEVLEQHTNDLLYYLIFLRGCRDEETYISPALKQSLYYCGENDHKDYIEQCGVTPRIAKKWLATYRKDADGCGRRVSKVETGNSGYLIKMPLAVFDVFKEWVMTKPARSRNSWTKVFCYMYYNVAWKRDIGMWSHSIQQMAAELSMDHGQLGEKIEELCGLKFFERSKYIFGEVSLARTYMFGEKIKNIL